MPTAIQVDNISKQYVLGRFNEGATLRETLTGMAANIFRKSRTKTDILWALKNVSFSVEEGEVVGIVGRNGAGKSTLLKVLSKITYPTSGRISVKGRVASLLEVGTGFHEELTGRENIYLNGSILGMTKKEVDSKFDAIVEFSGVARHIDTPIKRYSSGMRLRLGFAVAAHLDPEVLIVDEVLAVGDAGFQKKCLGAMEELRSDGRTVLFVSHNLAAVENLCTRAIWIENGGVQQDGPTREVIEAYMGTFNTSGDTFADLSSVT
ncbi:MAG TPA: ABC transporter ATP-binding protein, partial [Bryobacteraceae bacterium]|nr:ABC transporter ATP-binding protein [Bryobacteraceae bacterium]